jgi:virginiamycin A acetyltransferase
MRFALKRAFQFAALMVVWPAAALTLFGRFEPAFTFFSHTLALGPGIPGSTLRAAYYRLTLAHCSQDVRFGFGTLITKASASIARHVSFGNYCVVGNATIGEGCQISSLVNITSGKFDHPRGPDGRFVGGRAAHVKIGDYVFIASSAVVIADIGDYSTIGAGAIVVKPIPSGVVAVGNPARPVGDVAREGAVSANG